MKAITCRELGGACDFILSAETPEGMADLMRNHLREKHPIILANFEEKKHYTEWCRLVRKKWDSKPDVEPRPTYPNLD